MSIDKRSTYDEVYDSLVNGNFKQALRIAEENLDGYDIAEMLDYFDQQLEQPEMAIKFAKQYFFARER